VLGETTSPGRGLCGLWSSPSLPDTHSQGWGYVCVYYCSTYYKAVRVGGRGIVEDMCYERLIQGASAPVFPGSWFFPLVWD
jgi:hypothetical protein